MSTVKKQTTKKQTKQQKQQNKPTMKVNKKKKQIIIRGVGDYKTDFADFGHKYGGLIGGAVDKGKAILELLGMGDYRTRAQALNESYRSRVGPRHRAGSSANMSAKEVFEAIGMDKDPLHMNTSNATFETTEDGILVSKREMVMNVLGSVPFSSTQFLVTPSPQNVTKTFAPWISQQALLWTKYTALGIVVEFESLCADFSNDVALGSVMMNTQYDASQPELISSQLILNNQFTTSAKISEDFVHPIECAGMMDKYVYTDADLSTGADERQQNIGRFQISVEGVPSVLDGQIIGRMWVTSRYYFKYSVLTSAELSFGAPFYMATTNLDNQNTGVDNAGEFAQLNINNTIPLSLISVSTAEMALDFSGCTPGNYLVVLTGILPSATSISSTDFLYSQAGASFSPLGLFADSVTGLITDFALASPTPSVTSSTYTTGLPSVSIVTTLLFNASSITPTDNQISFRTRGLYPYNWTLIVTGFNGAVTSPTSIVRRTGLSKTLGRQSDELDYLRKQLNSLTNLLSNKGLIEKKNLIKKEPLATKIAKAPIKPLTTAQFQQRLLDLEEKRLKFEEHKDEIVDEPPRSTWLNMTSEDYIFLAKNKEYNPDDPVLLEAFKQHQSKSCLDSCEFCYYSIRILRNREFTILATESPKTVPEIGRDVSTEDEYFVGETTDLSKSTISILKDVVNRISRK